MSDEAPVTHPTEHPDHVPDLPHAHAVTWGVAELPHRGPKRELTTEQIVEAAIALAPDWVCEVLSPSTEAYDRGPKMETYGRHGVPWAWLVDPEGRTLEAFRNDGGAWRAAGRWAGDDEVRVAPFAAVALRLAVLWV